MNNIPKIALIGRPNVGKSSLFNALCKKRVAIVEETESVTRDRLYADVQFDDFWVKLIDTGGLIPGLQQPFQKEIADQTLQAIAEANILILVVDGDIGVTQLDERIAKQALKSGKRVVLAVNKLDGLSSEHHLHFFHGLGIREMIPVSAKRHRNLRALMSACLQGCCEASACYDQPSEMKEFFVSIIGRPNVGKSSLINRLANEKRCVVSSIAGTTRDAIDIQINDDDSKFTFIDTAGIRKKPKEKQTIEKYASMRTWDNIKKSDVCVLVLDSTQGMTHQEKRIAREIERQGKGCILFFNKWDLSQGLRMEHSLRAIREENPFFSHCPIFFGSAMQGRNVTKLLPTVRRVAENMSNRVPTGKLNHFLEKIMQLYHPPRIQGKRLKIYYLTQIDIKPPHFILFINRKDLMTDSYRRYLINQFRKEFQFLGCPIKFELREKLGQTENKHLNSKERANADHFLTEELLLNAVHAQEEESLLSFSDR